MKQKHWDPNVIRNRRVKTEACKKAGYGSLGFSSLNVPLDENLPEEDPVPMQDSALTEEDVSTEEEMTIEDPDSLQDAVATG